MHTHNTQNNEQDYNLRLPPLALYTAFLGIIITIIGLIIASQNSFSTLTISMIVIGMILLLPALVLSIVIRKSKDFRLHIRDKIVESVNWRGDEQVLDVGVGSGITLFGCVEQLTTGKGIGIDIYDPNSGGGTEENFWKNAQLASVNEKVDLQNVDARKMPFDDAQFDVIVSTLTFHHMGSSEDINRATQEIIRVLKPNGRLLVYDASPALNGLETSLRNAGFSIKREGKLFSLLQADKST